MYPDRFDAEGKVQQSCESGGSTVYGADNCKAVIEDWVAANSTPVAPCLGADACNAAIQCYAGNDAAGTS